MTENKFFWVVIINIFIIFNTLKWFFLAIIAGILVGFASSFFLLALEHGINWFSRINHYYLAIPFAFIASYLIIKTFAPEAKGHGTEKVIEAIHKRYGLIDFKVVPVKLVATLITIISGGSAGKEGPCAQIGAGVASTFARIFKMSKRNRKRFVLCGVGAGFAAVFGTPIAGAMFAGEVVYVGKFSYKELMPVLIASYFSFIISQYLGVSHLNYTIHFAVNSKVSIVFDMLFLGIFMGILAILFIYLLNFIEKTAKKAQISPYAKAFIGGSLLVIIVFLTKSTDFIGLGTHVIDSALEGNKIGGVSSFMKMFTTSVTLGTGGSGGILTPIFYIGSTGGNLWGQIVGGNLSFFSAVGMCAFLAATTNTPLAAILIAFELFGIETGTYGAIACIVSYLIVGHLSVYPSQILSENKTFFLRSKTHRSMGSIDVSDYSIKDRSLRRFLNKLNPPKK
jgi:H+/Cl- antiporter ClcA